MNTACDSDDTLYIFIGVCVSCIHVNRIVNSELTHFKGALSSLENITAFGSTLFDVWTVNR